MLLSSGGPAPEARVFSGTEAPVQFHRTSAAPSVICRRGHTLKREILINGSQRETRVAILEDDRLVELLVDRPDHRRTVGDIYLGRVEAVLPGNPGRLR